MKPTNKVQREALAKVRFANKVTKAAEDAYYAQERLTSDPMVKRAVSQAVQMMWAIILDEPYEEPKPTMEHVKAFQRLVGLPENHAPCSAPVHATGLDLPCMLPQGHGGGHEP